MSRQVMSDSQEINEIKISVTRTIDVEVVICNT